jgi:hypothetical protein
LFYFYFHIVKKRPKTEQRHKTPSVKEISMVRPMIASIYGVSNEQKKRIFAIQSTAVDDAVQSLYLLCKQE